MVVMRKGRIAAIIAAAIAIPVVAYGAGPTFINTTVDEALPESSSGEDIMMDKGEDGGNMEDKPEPTQAGQVGTFIGVGDGIHDAAGNAKVIAAEDGRVLRLEEFRSTNGPDLYVYLSVDKEATDYVNLGKLKGNIGNQNYEIPNGTDLSKYDTVLIWCQQFSVLFGSAALQGSQDSA